jgi:hypothetical protein
MENPVYPTKENKNEQCSGDILRAHDHGGGARLAFDFDGSGETTLDVRLPLWRLRPPAHGLAASAAEQDARYELRRALVVALGLERRRGGVAVRGRRAVGDIGGGTHRRAGRGQCVDAEILRDGVCVGKRVFECEREAGAYGYRCAPDGRPPWAGDDRGRRCLERTHVRGRRAGGEQGEVGSPAGGVGHGVERRGLVCVGCARDGRPAGAAEHAAVDDSVDAVERGRCGESHEGLGGVRRVEISGESQTDDADDDEQGWVGGRDEETGLINNSGMAVRERGSWRRDGSGPHA